MRQNSDHTAFYIDGPKTVYGTRVAATNINNYKPIRLANNASIYSAKLYAIKVALDMIKDSEMGKSIICFDSLSSLIGIQEGDQKNPYIQDIRETYH